MQNSPVEVQKVLKDINYLVNKKQLIEHTKKHKASSEVIEVLEGLPRVYQCRRCQQRFERK